MRSLLLAVLLSVSADAADKSSSAASTLEAETAARLRFHVLINSAKAKAEVGEFQLALKRYNQAVLTRPKEIIVDDAEAKLRRTLLEQSRPVDLSLESDGATWVSIMNFRGPRRFTSEVIKILPGDYTVTGQRRGYRDVVLQIKVRAGEPSPTVQVLCNAVSATTTGRIAELEDEEKAFTREYMTALAANRAKAAKAEAYFAEELASLGLKASTP